MERFFWKGQELPATMFIYKCKKQGLPHISYDGAFDLIEYDSTTDSVLQCNEPVYFGKGLVLIDNGSCYRVE